MAGPARLGISDLLLVDDRRRNQYDYRPRQDCAIKESAGLEVSRHDHRTFNSRLLEPKKGDTSVLATDKGPVILPKLYRRYTSWSVRHKAKVTSENFQQFLAAGSGGKPDACFETADFLANGVYSASPRTLDQFVVGGKTIKFQPDGLVFQEAPSKLVGANGKPISNF